VSSFERPSYDTKMLRPDADPPTGDTWLALSEEPLRVGTAYDWGVQPDCGAVVLFSGTARDHSSGRPDVSVLEYEAYDEHVVPRLSAIAEEARVRWPAVRRLLMWHRTGPVTIGDTAVVVVASSPHRDDAFMAARFCIDALKATVPIWKRESWAGGESWGLEAQHLTEADQIPGAVRSES
jgi:molybdopterin synthase catalytic subunit